MSASTRIVRALVLIVSVGVVGAGCKEGRIIPRDAAATDGKLDASCSACSGPVDGQATCDGTTCGSTCNSGYHNCGGSCVANTSIASCGTSCAPCTSSIVAQVVCASNACATACPVGINDHWNYALGAASSPWRSTWGDPSIDVASDHLILTFDDVVLRTPTPAGAYAFTFTLTFSGDLAFHIDFGISTNTQNEPALMSVGGIITLGGLRYGKTMTFGSFGSWAGQTATTNTAVVTYYVKNSAAAARVTLNGTVIKSGFIQIPTLSPSSLLQLVGGNTNGDSIGLGVTVTSLGGCAGFTDEQLTAVYNQ